MLAEISRFLLVMSYLPIRPQKLENCLTADLSFAGYELRKDFYGLLKNSICLAEAFQYQMTQTKTSAVTVAVMAEVVMGVTQEVKDQMMQE